ncbi:hypothetical protein [Nocardia brasiliensis]|uniref:hypothetical protein n=1 Tax=Nocardia brasiliensis TaxID=37326 RepID=UPI00030FBBEF|nr:hypothetical protein [Nocardia brasiliensis]
MALGAIALLTEQERCSDAITTAAQRFPYLVDLAVVCAVPMPHDPRRTAAYE